MKNFPFIPLMMWTAMTLVIIHGHKVSRENTPKVEYSMAAGVDAHLSKAREAFIAGEAYTFEKELEEATLLLGKEAHCEKCIDKEIAKQSLQPLIALKHQYQRDRLKLGNLDEVFGTVITALAKNHIVYTLEHLAEIEDEFYIEDAIRHLNFSMKYYPENVREKEKAAAEKLQKALVTHQLDREETTRLLSEVVAGI